MANIARDGKVFVRKTPCAHCLLSRDRLVDGKTAARLIADTRNTEGASFVCHRSAVSDEPETVCAAWFDRFGMDDVTFRLAAALGLIERI